MSMFWLFGGGAPIAGSFLVLFALVFLDYICNVKVGVNWCSFPQ